MNDDSRSQTVPRRRRRPRRGRLADARFRAEHRGRQDLLRLSGHRLAEPLPRRAARQGERHRPAPCAVPRLGAGHPGPARRAGRRVLRPGRRLHAPHEEREAAHARHLRPRTLQVRARRGDLGRAGLQGPRHPRVVRLLPAGQGVAGRGAARRCRDQGGGGRARRDRGLRAARSRSRREHAGRAGQHHQERERGLGSDRQAGRLHAGGLIRVDDALRDTRFVLHRLLQAERVYAALPAHDGVDAALIDPICEAAHAFTQGVLARLNAVGDREGCTLQADGSVKTPSGFAAAWRAFVDAGWPALACHPDDGGQGLPQTLEIVLKEAVSAANPGWGMFYGILHGGYACVRAHASDALKERYLPSIASGETLVTMALTEAQAGSDLGLARTRAEPRADGSVQVVGTKIFISGADHDLTRQIVHLVLARLPDAPPGSKGLSLFLVPKWLPDGTRNAVVVERLEEKMGLHGSPTCVLRFDGAAGWIVGEPGRGLAAMFVMMNAARIAVGLQGVGAAAAALAQAEAYAMDRVQSGGPGLMQRPG